VGGDIPMIDAILVRQRAEVALGADNVHLVREIPTGRDDCSLSMWVETGAKPASFVTLLEVPEEVVCTTASFHSFERLLKVLKPNLLATDNLKCLFREAAPGRMGLVESRKDLGWIPKYEAVWHEPRYVGSRMEFFCNDFASGRFYRVTVSDSYDLEIEDIGPGKKLPRR
jgi:hypothetical protein